MTVDLYGRILVHIAAYADLPEYIHLYTHTYKYVSLYVCRLTHAPRHTGG